MREETGADEDLIADEEVPPDGAGDAEGRVETDRPPTGAVSSVVIEQLRELQAQRRFCIKSQSRCDRSAEAMIARYLGYASDQDEKSRKAVWKQASAVRKSAEGGEGLRVVDNRLHLALTACLPIILISAQSRSGWDSHRKQTERAMRTLALQLPASQFMLTVCGFAALGLAIIVGESGDLANYATKERLWKRLGLAVIDGERQRRIAGAEAAARHGFVPQRRAEVWAIADSLFKNQFRGEKDGVAAHPIGPYGAVYARRKAHTITREWTPAHRDADARRVMTKALIEDVWRVWRGLPPLAGKTSA